MKTSLLVSVLHLLFLLSLSASIFADDNGVSGDKSIFNRTSFYGCEKYEEYTSCDPSRNELEGFSIGSTSKEITPITRDPNYVDGKNGKAIEFRDKYRDFVEVPNKDMYKSDTFSISFWVKKINEPTQSEPFAHLISFTSFREDEGWFFNTNGSIDQAIRFGLTSNTAKETTMSEPVSISNNTFTHIAATFNGSHIEIYNNGSIFETKKYDGIYSAPERLPIHIATASYCSECGKFQGVIDDIRLYNRTISKEEVGQLYNYDGNSTLIHSGISPINKGLTGFWTFDSTLDDASQYKNPGKMLTMLSSMASSPDGRIFISEKNTGKIKVLQDDALLERPFAVINDSYVSWETGLLGLAIDPEFETNHFVYLYYSTTKNSDEHVNRVVRFTEKDNLAVNMSVILDNIPASAFHAGGAMAFAPDKTLYITVGDARDPSVPQNEKILAGKVLRINRDGSIPKDNPFPNSPVYTTGHRNMFGIAFDEKNNIGIITENGDKIHDEVNIIKKGGNYGFPTLQLANISPELSKSTLDIKPLRSYHNVIAPTQAIFYTGNGFPSLKGTFLFGTYTGDIYGVNVNNDTENIDLESHVQLEHYPFESVIGLTQTHNGSIYYGGYHLYKLVSISKANPNQILFPLRLDYTNNIAIDGVQSEIQKFVNIDLDYNDNRVDNATGMGNYNQYIKIKIPKALIDTIGDVNATVLSTNGKSTYRAAQFLLDDRFPRHNEITVFISGNATTNIKINKGEL